MTATTTVNPAVIKGIVSNQRDFFRTGDTKSVSFRIAQLKKLREMVVKYETQIQEALFKDLHKPAFEAYGTEVGFTLLEIDDMLDNVERWARPRPVHTPLFHLKASSFIQPDPYGAVLIISPWNYPFQLLIAPLAGALAAGNTVVLKPSELAPHTSELIKKMIGETFDKNYVAVVDGGVEESKILLEQRWDYIFFTGGTEVGRIVYQAAAKHLTPVTLELGGKSPCIIDKNVDVNMAAKRIAWGKFTNAGQTCIAPDYLMVHEDVKDKLLSAIEKHVVAFYGENPQASKDYCRIINERHFNRLVSYITDGEVYHGGQHDKADKFIAPTILTGVDADSKVMQEEVFGPILPVMTFKEVDEAIDFVNDRAKPLALYVFTKSDRVARKVLESTSSGGACVNDVVMHMANPSLPFGGVGDSGIGAYHSQSSFELFSHMKSVMHRSFLIDAPVKYPPYKLGVGVIKKLMKWTL